MSFCNNNLPKDLIDAAARVLAKARGQVVEAAPAKEDDEMLKKKAAVDAQSGLPELGEEGCGSCGNDADDDNAIIKGPPGQKRMAATQEEQEGEEEPSAVEKAASLAKTVAAVAENYASPEPSSAVGFRNEAETPKYANVIHDTSIIGGVMESSYRLLVTYPNKWCEIVPSSEHAGAKSIQELLSLTSHIIDPKNIIGEAIADALMIPSEEPRFRGNDKK